MFTTIHLYFALLTRVNYATRFWIPDQRLKRLRNLSFFTVRYQLICKRAVTRIHIQTLRKEPIKRLLLNKNNRQLKVIAIIN